MQKRVKNGSSCRQANLPATVSGLKLRNGDYKSGKGFNKPFVTKYFGPATIL